MNVTQATGPCAGETGVQPPRNVTITQNGSYVRITGFLVSASETFLGGNLISTSDQIWKLYVSGGYNEDDGVTNVNFQLDFNRTFTEMTGIEYWTWRRGGETCIRESDLKAIKIN